MFFLKTFQNGGAKIYSPAYATMEEAEEAMRIRNASPEVEKDPQLTASLVPFPVKLTLANIREQRFAFTGNDTDAAKCIGHLRADFGSGGSGFYTTWFDHKNPELKTSEFKLELDMVINELRAGPFKSREAAREFNANPANTFQHVHPCYRDDDNCFVYRFNSMRYAYIVRLAPRKGDYDIYVYCYEKSHLDGVLEQDKKLTVNQWLQKEGVSENDIVVNSEKLLRVRYSRRADLALHEWANAHYRSHDIWVRAHDDPTLGPELLVTIPD